MDKIISKVVLSQEELSDITSRLGAQITKDYKGKNLIIVSILKGAIMFMTDLVRKIDLPCKLDFMETSSYFGGLTNNGGNVKILKDLSMNIRDMDVLIVEDILESGYTMECVIRMLKSRLPSSLKICSLLDKPSKRKVNIKPDYVGKEIPREEFVLGYGMDYDEKYRNLPFVGVINKDLLGKK